MKKKDISLPQIVSFFRLYKCEQLKIYQLNKKSRQ